LSWADVSGQKRVKAFIFSMGLTDSIETFSLTNSGNTNIILLFDDSAWPERGVAMGHNEI
jgi:hypothetical protein